VQVVLDINFPNPCSKVSCDFLKHTRRKREACNEAWLYCIYKGVDDACYDYACCCTEMRYEVEESPSGEYFFEKVCIGGLDLLPKVCAVNEYKVIGDKLGLANRYIEMKFDVDVRVVHINDFIMTLIALVWEKAKRLAEKFGSS